MKIITHILVGLIIAFAINLLSIHIAQAEGEDQPTIEEGSTISSPPFEPEQ